MSSQKFQIRFRKSDPGVEPPIWIIEESKCDFVSSMSFLHQLLVFPMYEGSTNEYQVVYVEEGTAKEKVVFSCTLYVDALPVEQRGGGL